MCDTLVATADVTAAGFTLFAKNSDRDPNEAQHVVLLPALDHPPNSNLQCTYIQIPQVAHTHAILLSKPFWIWGAEMGVNEHGVAIGNEAVFTRLGYSRETGLIGMDLLRLALERGATASEALTVITELLTTYGQGGDCGFQRPLIYHNSFLIADPSEAWVLETAGPHWAAKRVTGVYTISNSLTLDATWDLAAPGFVEEAVNRRWCRSAADFSFRRCYSDRVYTKLSDARRRRARTMALLEAEAGAITPSTMMAALRDHGDRRTEARPDRGILGATVCMHAGFGPVRRSQTTGSLVAQLAPNHALAFVTDTAAPCTSLFKPLWLDAGLPDDAPPPTGKYDPRSRFWRHERLHRATLKDYRGALACYGDARDALEQVFITGAAAHAEQPLETRRAFTNACFARSDAAEAEWTTEIEQATSARQQRTWLHRYAWHRWSRGACIATSEA